MAAINNSTISNRSNGAGQNNSDDEDSVTGKKETKIEIPVNSPPQYSTLSAEKFNDKKVKVCITIDADKWRIFSGTFYLLRS